MKSLTKHIRTAGTLLLLLFLLANSGFTIALVHCTMCDDSAELRGCCEEMAGMDRPPVEGKERNSADAMLAASPLPCMVVTLAGGIPSDPTIVEKATAERVRVRFDLMPTSAPTVADARIAVERPILHSSPPPSGSLLSVEKYILAKTLLI